EGLPRLDLLLHGEVDASVPHLVGIPLANEVILDQIGPESGKSLVDIQRQQLEPDGGSLLREAQEVEKRPGILAARHADQDPVPGLDEPEVADGLAEARHQASLEPLVFAHVGRASRRDAWDCSAPRRATSTDLVASGLPRTCRKTETRPGRRRG